MHSPELRRRTQDVNASNDARLHMLRLACALQKLRAAAKEVDEQQSQIFRLEVRLAEANKKLEHTADLEKELLHYRYCSQLLLFCTHLGRSRQ